MSELHEFCQAFIERMGITCAETIYQTDKVIENAFEFIEGICQRVGYLDDEENEDD